MDIQKKLKQIATLRETKGKEQDTYKLIDEAKKETTQPDILAKLYWEESLVAQHEVMNEKSSNTPNQETIEQATKHMEEAAQGANKIIQENNLEKMKGTAYRFLGNTYRYKKDYKKAQEYFEKALEAYQEQGDKGTLEIRGFIASTLVHNNNPEGGIKLALETFDAYETEEKAKKLKQNDYFTWAVWRSGIIPRLIEALEETNSEYDKETILEYLNESERILKEPEGNITWGDNAFQLRVDEINKVRKIITV